MTSYSKILQLNWECIERLKSIQHVAVPRKHPLRTYLAVSWFTRFDAAVIDKSIMAVKSKETTALLDEIDSSSSAICSKQDYIVDFKLSPCFICNAFSFGYLPGVRVLKALLALGRRGDTQKKTHYIVTYYWHLLLKTFTCFSHVGQRNTTASRNAVKADISCFYVALSYKKLHFVSTTYSQCIWLSPFVSEYMILF